MRTMVYTFSSLSCVLGCPLALQVPLFPTREDAFLFWVWQSRISENSWFKTTEMYPPGVRNPKSRRQHKHAHTKGSREPFLWWLLGIPSVPVCFQSFSFIHLSLKGCYYMYTHLNPTIEFSKDSISKKGHHPRLEMDTDFGGMFISATTVTSASKNLLTD